uniref:PH domain-containing protein n=1 Tax=Rhodosorus marinus TaxID=101924 RepID=A0A7S3A4N4_9RHOD|mmetsp:Transcript_41183/g.162536  ORF Transcript_41183/g.162536 Transcript_41183/m.162536 type:complete len:226 (+) Transcript_41183:189-866(+)|eukprot:CAMPEP_0113961130 /NCGR_PEP_ID=MMETSP0011_2-20120614/5122_1 /TAXON_ID=101924 /ORGANISM="Rhodosorus marinus" /LENGTH=225 /DNA_ID=CAMNT_0000972705 /DNA_START=164 /DNA_END=841 /DNA_ORIENTATION=+ /assembly_acc=CAM_ASM_000156
MESGSQSNKENAYNNLQPMRDVSKTIKLMQKLDRGTDEGSDGEPMSPYTSWLPRYNDEPDEEEVMDLPQKLMGKPEATKQVHDLKRCSVRIGKDLREATLNRPSPGNDFPAAANMAAKREKEIRVQGELNMKTGFIFKTWRRRYGSVVEHAYFGPVLFLFKYDSEGNIEVQHSDMIALVDCSITVGKDRKVGPGGRYEWNIKTSRKKYRLAVSDAKKRDFWIDHM